MRQPRHKLRRVLLLMVLYAVGIATAGYSANYYVDIVGGDDSNTGFVGSPWKTISKVNGASFSAGDSVLFKRGLTWREQLAFPSSGSSGNPIVVGAYGSGDPPIISAADLLTSWSEQTSNIWFALPDSQSYVVYTDGNRGIEESAKGNLNTEYEWFWKVDSLFVYSASDPGVAYSDPGVESGARESAVKVGWQDYVHFEDLSLRQGNVRIGTVDEGTGLLNHGSTYIVVRNCTSERSFGHGIHFYENNHGNCTIVNCILQDNGKAGFMVQGATLGYHTVRDCTVQNNGWRDVNSSGIEGTLPNAVIKNNTITNSGSGRSAVGVCHGVYLYAAAAGAAVYENTIYGNAHGYGIAARVSVDIYRNLIYNNANAGILVRQENSGYDITANIYYNVLYGNRSGILELPFTGGNELNMNICNNLLYHNVYGALPHYDMNEIVIDDVMTSLIIKNNIIYPETTDSHGHQAYSSNNAFTGTIDNNCVYKLDAGTFIWYNSGNRTWAWWQSQGFDTNSPNLDPELLDPVNNDFHLKHISPAIDAGEDLGYVLDFEKHIVPRGQGVDIGAFEREPQRWRPGDFRSNWYGGWK